MIPERQRITTYSIVVIAKEKATSCGLIQSMTYQKEPRRYEIQRIPVLFVMTSNCPEEYYPALGYRKMLKTYQKALNEATGLCLNSDRRLLNEHVRFHGIRIALSALSRNKYELAPELPIDFGANTI